MDFCGRAYHGIPKHLHKSDPWLKEMMPYYRRHCRNRAQPEGNINIPNCIRCCLSATIPDGVKPSPLLQLPHPDPVPGYDKPNDVNGQCNTFGEQLSPADDNLNEHVISNLTSALEKQQHHLDSSDDDDEDKSKSTCTSSSSTSSIQSKPELKDVDDDDLSSDDEDFYYNIDSDDEEDYEFHKDPHPNTQPNSLPPLVPSTRKRKLDNAVTTLRKLPTKSSDSMDYLSEYATNTFKSPNYKNITRRYVKSYNKANKNNTANVISHEFVGALVLPTHKLILCNYTYNKQLYVDIHGMAESTADGTPTIPHLVLTEANALALDAEFARTNTKAKYLDDENQWIRERVDNVEMPEDPTKTRAWTIDHTTISQKVKVSHVMKANGCTEIPVEELAQYEVFSYKHTSIRKHADFILIDGDFCMEEDMKLANLRKLLTLRIQTMIKRSITDEDAKSMYTNLRAISGRWGSEVTRTSGTGGYVTTQSHKDLLTSGTGGYVTTQSHKDLLFVLHENDGLLPNKAGACLIVPHKKYSYILYSKHAPASDEHPIGLTTYPPPKPG
jgi:hypothetical protein